MITSVNNPRIKEINALHKKKQRDEKGLFLVEGKHMVEEAIKHNLAITIITTDQNYQADCELLYVSDAVMHKLATTKTPQPYMAVCKKFAYTYQKQQRSLLLDCIQDPGNLGTILRTALALGYDQVILSPDTVDLYNEKVLRATQGATFRLPIIVEDLKTIIPQLKQDGVEVVGTALRNAKDIHDIKKKDYMAFVMGNEGNGMHDEIADLCDERLYIPINNMESLNVGIAAAIVMYTYREE